MKTIGSTLILALGVSVSGCILLLDTDKLHSDNGGAAGTSSAGAAGAVGTTGGTSGTAGDAGKAGKSGKGLGAGGGAGGSGGMLAAGGTGGQGGVGMVCLSCLGAKCAKEGTACELKPACKACLADSAKPGCAMDLDYLSFVGCACFNCTADCALNCGAAGKGGG